MRELPGEVVLSYIQPGYRVLLRRFDEDYRGAVVAHWLVEERSDGGTVMRFGTDDEASARRRYFRTVAIRAGDLQCMLFGIPVDGVGDPPFIDGIRVEYPIHIASVPSRHWPDTPCEVFLRLTSEPRPSAW